jgi:hypothetical protein
MSQDLKVQMDRLAMMAGLVNENSRYKIVEGIPLNEKTDYVQYDPSDFSDQEKPDTNQPHGYLAMDSQDWDHEGGEGDDLLDLSNLMKEYAERKTLNEVNPPMGGLTRREPGTVKMGGVGLGFAGWEPNDEMITGASGLSFEGEDSCCQTCGDLECDCPEYDEGQFDVVTSDMMVNTEEYSYGVSGHGPQKPSRGDSMQRAGLSAFIKGPGFR